MPCKLGQSCQASNQCEEGKQKQKSKALELCQEHRQIWVMWGGGGGRGCRGCNNYYSLYLDIHVTQRKRLCKI